MLCVAVEFQDHKIVLAVNTQRAAILLDQVLGG